MKSKVYFSHLNLIDIAAQNQIEWHAVVNYSGKSPIIDKQKQAQSQMKSQMLHISTKNNEDKTTNDKSKTSNNKMYSLINKNTDEKGKLMKLLGIDGNVRQNLCLYKNMLSYRAMEVQILKVLGIKSLNQKCKVHHPYQQSVMLSLEPAK